VSPFCRDVTNEIGDAVVAKLSGFAGVADSLAESISGVLSGFVVLMTRVRAS